MTASRTRKTLRQCLRDAYLQFKEAGKNDENWLTSDERDAALTEYNSARRTGAVRI
jgi:hypothetical protein